MRALKLMLLISLCTLQPSAAATTQPPDCIAGFCLKGPSKEGPLSGYILDEKFKVTLGGCDGRIDSIEADLLFLSPDLCTGDCTEAAARMDLPGQKWVLHPKVFAKAHHHLIENAMIRKGWIQERERKTDSSTLTEFRHPGKTGVRKLRLMEITGQSYAVTLVSELSGFECQGSSTSRDGL
jgi:hypothetical protein